MMRAELTLIGRDGSKVTAVQFHVDDPLKAAERAMRWIRNPSDPVGYGPDGLDVSAIARIEMTVEEVQS